MILKQLLNQYLGGDVMLYNKIFIVAMILISIFDLLMCLCILFLQRHNKLAKSSTKGLILTNLVFLGLCYIVAFVATNV